MNLFGFSILSLCCFCLLNLTSRSRGITALLVSALLASLSYSEALGAYLIPTVIIGMSFLYFVFKNRKGLSENEVMSIGVLTIYILLSFLFPSIDVLSGFILIITIQALEIMIAQKSTVGSSGLKHRLYLMTIQLVLTFLMFITYKQNYNLFTSIFAINSFLSIGMFDTSTILDRGFIRNKTTRNLMDFVVLFVRPIVVMKLTIDTLVVQDIRIGVVIFLPIMLMSIFSLFSTREYGKKQVFYRKIGILNLSTLFMVSTFLELANINMLFVAILVNYLVFEVIFYSEKIKYSFKSLLEKIYHGIPFVPLFLVTAFDYSDISNTEKIYFCAIVIFSSLPMIFYSTNRSFSRDKV